LKLLSNSRRKKLILTEITRAGLVVENDRVFAARLGSFIFKRFLADIVEFSREVVRDKGRYSDSTKLLYRPWTFASTRHPAGADLVVQISLPETGGSDLDYY
jgi:hypothetical protein